VTEVAIEGLNAVQLGDSTLRVKRSCVGTQQASGLEQGVSAMSMLAGSTSADLQQTRVLQLLNMVTAEDLMDNEEYEGEIS
jgi:splicing factor U2AF subunit